MPESIGGMFSGGLQEDALGQATTALRSLMPPGCGLLEYRGDYLHGECTSIVNARTVDGEKIRWNGSIAPATSAFKHLRRVMYRPGEGSWFSVFVTVWVDGRSRAEFFYDVEPEWIPPRPTGIQFLTDQHFFPIDEDKQPQWLKDRLAAGVAELHKYGKKSYPKWLREMIAAGNKPSWL